MNSLASIFIFICKQNHTVFIFKVVDAAGHLMQLGLEAFNLFTLGTSMFIDQISDSFQGGQLQAVGVPEGQALDRPSTVISGLCSLDFVVQEDDLGAGPSEDFIGGPDVHENSIGCVNLGSGFQHFRVVM